MRKCWPKKIFKKCLLSFIPPNILLKQERRALKKKKKKKKKKKNVQFLFRFIFLSFYKYLDCSFTISAELLNSPDTILSRV